MVLVNEPHEFLKPVLSLESLLLGFSVLVGFFGGDCLLRLVTLMELLGSDLS